MSSREAIAQGRAMTVTLASFKRRSVELTRRARWPGATQSVVSPVTIQIPFDTVGGAPVWNTVLSLSLNPGNWMVVGSATVTRPSGISAPVSRNGMRIAGTTTVRDGKSQDGLSTTSGSLFQAHAPLALPIGGGVATLEVFSQMNAGGVGGYQSSITDASLIAYPV